MLADDALHEAFSNVVCHHESFAAADSPLRFLCRNVCNACFDQLRREKCRREDSRDLAPGPASSHPAVDIEIRDVITGLLADLDDDQRRIAVCACGTGRA